MLQALHCSHTFLLAVRKCGSIALQWLQKADPKSTTTCAATALLGGTSATLKSCCAHDSLRFNPPADFRGCTQCARPMHTVSLRCSVKMLRSSRSVRAPSTLLVIAVAAPGAGASCANEHVTRH